MFKIYNDESLSGHFQWRSGYLNDVHKWRLLNDKSIRCLYYTAIIRPPNVIFNKDIHVHEEELYD